MNDYLNKSRALILFVLVVVGISTMVSAESSTENHKATISGTVYDARTKNSIPNVTVALVQLAGCQHNQYYGKPLQEVQTNQDGSFTITKPNHDDRFPHWESLRFSAPGYESGLYFNDYPDEPHRRLKIYLRKATSLQGTVVDDNGKPVSNALVGGYIVDNARKSETYKFTPHLAPSFWAYTNSNGEFHLEGIRKGFQPFIRACADGYLPTTTEPIDLTQKNRLQITLNPGGTTVEGIILEEDGSPAPNKFVRVKGRPPQWYQTLDTQRPVYLNLKVKSDKNGRFTIHNLQALTYEFTIKRRGDSEKASLRYETFKRTIGPDSQQQEVFQFSSPTRYKGKVVDATTKKGLPDVTVWSTYSFDTVTDKDGCFSMEIYNFINSSGDYRILYSIPSGYTSKDESVDYGITSFNKDEIDSPDTFQINLVPTNLPYQRKTITLKTAGNTLIKSDFAFLGRTANNVVTYQIYHTDEKGMFEASVLPDETYYIGVYNSKKTVNDSSPSAWAARRKFNKPESNISINLPPCYPVSLRLINEDGMDLKELGLYLYPVNTPQKFVPLGQQGLGFPISFKSRSQSREGRHIFFAGLPGKALLSVQRNANDILYAKEVDIQDQGPTDLGDIVINMGPIITITPTWPEGVDSKSFSVKCYVNDKEIKPHISGFHQKQISGLKKVKGPLKIILTASNMEKVVLENIPYRTQTINPPFKENPHISIKVSDTNTNQPVSNVSYMLSMAVGNANVPLFTKSGRPFVKTPLKFFDLNRGKYIISIIGMTKDKKYDGRMGFTSFEVGDKNSYKEIPVSISPDYHNSINGHISILNNHGSIEGARVILSYPPPKGNVDIRMPLDYQQTTTDPDGNFEFPQVAPGRFFLTVEKEGFIQKDKYELFIVEDHPAKPSLQSANQTKKNPQGLMTVQALSHQWSMEQEAKEKTVFNLTLSDEKEKKYLDIEVYATTRVICHIITPDKKPFISKNLSLTRESPAPVRHTHSEIAKDNIFIFNKPYPGINNFSIRQGVHPFLMDEKINITPGKEINLTYDFSNFIYLTGSIKIDNIYYNIEGKPNEPNNLYLIPLHSSRRNIWRYIVPQGTYSMVLRTNDFTSTASTFTTSGSGNNYNLTTALTSIPVELTFKFPKKWEKPQNPSLNYSLLPEENQTYTGSVKFHNRRSPNLLKLYCPGTYRFQGHYNENYIIDSGPIEITEGENNITLKVKAKTN